MDEILTGTTEARPRRRRVARTGVARSVPLRAPALFEVRSRRRSRVRVVLGALALSVMAHAAGVLALGSLTGAPLAGRPLRVRLLPPEEVVAVALDGRVSDRSTPTEARPRRERSGARVRRPLRSVPTTTFPSVPSADAGAPLAGAGTEAANASGAEARTAATVSLPTPVRVLHSVRPDYPPRARREGAVGTVRLRARVLASGRVADVVLDESAGNAELDRAAALALARWFFEPLSEASGSEEVWVVVPIVFRLR